MSGASGEASSASQPRIDVDKDLAEWVLWFSRGWASSTQATMASRCVCHSARAAAKAASRGPGSGSSLSPSGQSQRDSG
jgi:hypothetical protein